MADERKDTVPAKTTYLVFRRADDDSPGAGPDRELWEPVGQARVPSGQGKTAIRQVGADKDVAFRNGSFVACPERSWQPIQRKVTTREVDEWE